MFELNNTNPNESLTISANPAIAGTTSNPTNILTSQVMPTVYQDLQRFAADPNLNEKLKLAFGSDYNVQTAQTIVENWLIGDFSTIPPIELVERGDITGANGAFAAATNKIYLSKDILTGDITNTGAVEDVILEEIGHSIDVLVNAVDAPGDEGEIFAVVVKKKTFDAADLARLKAEDDSTTINRDGEKYLAEMNSFPIQGSIGYYYYRSDNASIRNALGLATSNEFQVPNGWRQNFQNGAIFHSSQGTFVAQGSLGDYYLKLGGERSSLGLPTSNEIQVPNGWRQNFQNGAVFHSGAGSYTVRGSLGNYYLNNLGGERSQLGLPTSNEFQVPNGWRQNFQNGAIFHSGAGSYTVRGSLGNYYLNNLGGERSQLGLPTSNEFQVPNGWRQNFERGYVNWWNTGNGTFTLNSSPLVSSAQQANSFFKLQYRNPTYNSSGPNGSTNCGPASLAMIRKMFGMEQANISVETSIDHARYLMFGYSNGTIQGVPVLNEDKVWTSFNNVKNGIKNSNGTAEDLTGWDNLDRSLAAGKPVINYGTLTNAWRGQFPSRVGIGSGGHWNAILGKTSDGKYIVADPMHEGGTVAMTKTQLSVFNANPQFIAFARK